VWLEFKTGPETGRRVEVRGARFTVGREGAVDLAIADPKVSRNHAYFQDLGPRGTALYDNGSSNGTFVNGHRITAVTLSGSEAIQFGETLLQASPTAPAGSADYVAAGGVPPRV
jgi:pSer/pThr/pTyr-binding forkhead associated (FHA) protein